MASACERVCGGDGERCEGVAVRVRGGGWQTRQEENGIPVSASEGRLPLDTRFHERYHFREISARCDFLLAKFLGDHVGWKLQCRSCCRRSARGSPMKRCHVAQFSVLLQGLHDAYLKHVEPARRIETHGSAIAVHFPPLRRAASTLSGVPCFIFLL